MLKNNFRNISKLILLNLKYFWGRLVIDLVLSALAQRFSQIVLHCSRSTLIPPKMLLSRILDCFFCFVMLVVNHHSAYSSKDNFTVKWPDIAKCIITGKTTVHVTYLDTICCGFAGLYYSMEQHNFRLAVKNRIATWF